MSELPDGWQRHVVGDLITQHCCGPSPDCEEREIRGDQEWGVLKTTAITWDGWDERQHKVLPRAYWGLRQLAVQRDDVLVTKAGPRHRVGVTATVTTSPTRLITSGKMIGLRPDLGQVVPCVLARALALREPQKYLNDRTTGMAESQVNFANTALLSTPLSLPLLPEQRAIAAVLDTIDDAIRKTEQIIAKLQQVKQGLLHDLLTRGIDDNGELRDPDRHPEHFQDSPLGRIPKEWEVAPLSSVAVVERGQFTHRPRNDPAYYGGVHPFIQTGDVAAFRGGFLKTFSQTLNDKGAAVSRQFPAGTIAITIAANIADTAILPAPMFFPDSVVGAVVAELAVVRFVELCIRRAKPRLEARAPQSAQKNINLQDLRPLPIPVAGHAEQDRIATVYEATSSRLESEQSSLQKLIALKAGVAEDLLTGRVRTTSLGEVAA